MINYTIYTDASFSHRLQMGVSGFFIFDSSEEQGTEINDSSLINTMLFEEKNNIRAELRGAIVALEAVEDKLAAKAQKDFNITLYTDCQTLSHLLERREKLESVDYTSKRTKKILANADLYQQIFSLYDRLHPKIIWIRGHSPVKDQSNIAKNFSRIDKAVRDKLRENK